MEWTTGLTFQLIELYKSKPCLWDPNCPHYKLIHRKNAAWLEIASEINAEPGEVKKKINSLLASFRRERQKENGSKIISEDGVEVSKSTWFAFKSLHFLRDKFISKRSLNMQESDGGEDAPTIKVIKREKISDHIDQPYTLMRSQVNLPQKSRNSIYGEYVASKLDSYSLHCQNTVQHLMNNILYDADMGKYDARHSTPPTISSSTNSGNIAELCAISPDNITCEIILDQPTIEDEDEDEASTYEQ